MIQQSKKSKFTRATCLVAAQSLLLISAGHAALAANQNLPGPGSGVPVKIADATSDSQAGGDDKNIRQQAADYARLYAAHDAKGLAAMWTADGTFTDSHGREHVGRAAIEQYFSEGFQGSAPQTLDIVLTSLKFPATSVAVEEGTSRISSGPGMGSMGHYLAVHTKVDGKWLMSTCSETDCSATNNYEYLKDLEWMVGDWSVKEQPQAARLKVNWSKNKTFLFCRYIRPESKDDRVEELQIIGWDPHSAEIAVWHFGARGGFGSGRLICDGHNWIERATATEPDGSMGRASYKLTKLDDNSFTWQSTRRVVAGQELPDSNPLTIVRDRSQ